MSVMPAEANAKQPGSKYDRLIAAAKGVPTVTTVVVHPCDESSLRGAIESAEAGIIKAILVGPAARIKDVAVKHGLNISGYEIVDTAPTEAAAASRPARAPCRQERERSARRTLPERLPTDTPGDRVEAAGANSSQSADAGRLAIPGFR